MHHINSIYIILHKYKMRSVLYNLIFLKCHIKWNSQTGGCIMLGEIVRRLSFSDGYFSNKSIYLRIQYLSKIMINLVYNENKHNHDIFFKRSNKDVSFRGIWPFHWLLLLTRKNSSLQFNVIYCYFIAISFSFYL